MLVQNITAAISAQNFNHGKPSILKSQARGNFSTCMSTLEERLLSKNLKPLDVGGDGDCFFKAVSHQLYHSPKYHQNVRKAAIDYISAHPEQFIESITENCWNDFKNMSAQGTWCDAIMVQAVANGLNCIIDITESAVNFNETTIVHPTYHPENPETIHIGHMDEFYYVSTTDALMRKQENLLNNTDNIINNSSPCPQKTTIPAVIKPSQYITDSNKTKRQHSNTQTESKAPQRKKQRIFSNTQPKSEDSQVTKQLVASNDTLIESFHNSIECGPEYVCTCCDQLWYRSSVRLCNSGTYHLCNQNMLKLCITNVKSVNDREWIYGTCHSNLKAGKLPVCSKANNMSFPEKPDVLNLTSLEERMISPRIPFM